MAQSPTEPIPGAQCAAGGERFARSARGISHGVDHVLAVDPQILEQRGIEFEKIGQGNALSSLGRGLLRASGTTP